LDTSADPTNTSAAVTPEETVIPQLPKLEKNPAIDPAKPMIVLSFDDGPSAYTERLLDILEKHGAKGTFFLVGKGISYRADTVKRMYEAGHDVGTHTWSHPELFEFDEDGFPTVVAGVPPDAFSATGQLWGNPIYRWKYHKATGYDWWIKRLEHVFKLYDVVRIDHFRGFDEYWAVPYGDKDAMGGNGKRAPVILCLQP
jgi:peptidoglycan/xylan/chitin deacetylase (PgdA/CDA1 family)